MAINTQVPNIYVVGAPCTGKTTLVKALQDHFEISSKREDTPGIISEVARTILRTQHFTADDIRSSPDRSLTFQQLILTAQLSAERAVLENNKWFISDRSGIDPIVYAKRYVSQEAATKLFQTLEWIELKERMGRSLIIVCEPGSGWLKDDGVRLMPEDMEDWVQFHKMFCSTLDEMGLQYETLPHEMDNIIDRARHVIAKWELGIYVEHQVRE
ncbi:hypothetical protein AAE478_007850 [Parahypoxylon ruwenzoriense]